MLEKWNYLKKKLNNFCLTIKKKCIIYININNIFLICSILVLAYIVFRFSTTVENAILNAYYGLLDDYGPEWGRLHVEALDARHCATHSDVLRMVDDNPKYEWQVPGEDFIMVLSNVEGELRLSIRKIYPCDPHTGTVAHWVYYKEFYKDPDRFWGHLYHKGKWPDHFAPETQALFEQFMFNKHFQRQYLPDGACILRNRRHFNLPADWNLFSLLTRDDFYHSTKHFYYVDKWNEKQESLKRKKKEFGSIKKKRKKKN